MWQVELPSGKWKSQAWSVEAGRQGGFTAPVWREARAAQLPMPPGGLWAAQTCELGNLEGCILPRVPAPTRALWSP